MTQDNLQEIFDALREGRFDDHERLVRLLPKGDETDELWSRLASEHGKGLDLFERLLAWPPARFQSAVRFLLPAVERLTGLKLPEALRFLEFGDRVGETWRHTVADQLRPRIAADPALGEALAESLRHGPLGPGARRIGAIAFTQAAPVVAAAYASRLASADPPEAGFLALLLIALPRDQLALMALDASLERGLTRVLVDDAPTVGLEAWLALAALADHSQSALDALLNEIERADTDALAAASNWLLRVDAAAVGPSEMPLSELVSTLLDQGLKNEKALRFIDMGVASLLHRQTTRDAVLPSVSRLRSVDANLDEGFSEVLGAISERPQDLVSMLTHWLLAEDAALPAVSSLLKRISLHGAPAGIDPGLFSAAPPHRQIAAARRLILLSGDGATICAFIGVLAQSPALQPSGLQVAAAMLDEAFEEFPGATDHFLRSRTRAAARAEPWAALYRGAYARALKWRRVLAQLPELNETRPTDAERGALRSMRQRVSREIMRVAGKGSVLTSLFTTVNVAQGQRFASRVGGAAPKVFEMTKASHSIELPSSEIADPVGGLLRRAAIRAGAR